MIKKIVIRDLNSSLTHLGIGKVKIYDGVGNVIETGDVVSDDSFIGETDNFKCIVNNSYIGSYPIDIINSDDGDYWISDVNTDVSIEIVFKKFIDSVSGISIIPLPSDLSTIGITESFNIDVYDYNDIIIQTYNVIPTTIRNVEQMISTNELVKYYIVSDLETVSTLETSRLNNIENIIKIDVEQEEPDNTVIRYLFSVDDKNTWFAIRDGIIQAINFDDILINGMSKTEIENIKNFNFNQIVNLDIAVGFNTKDKMYTPVLYKISIQY